MKYTQCTVLFGLLLLTLVAACALAATQPPTGVPPSSNETLVNPTDESQAQWKVVIPKTNVGDKWRMAAFLDESFGLTGGAGDAGKARYTSDGGKNWAVADSSGG